MGVSRDMLDMLKQRRPEIGVVVTGDMLQHREQTLQAHAGVDVGGGEWGDGTSREAFVLHKDQIPELNNVRVVLVDQI